MPPVDEPNDIDLILVMPTDWDMARTDLRPFEYNVLSKQELESRYEVWVEQYWLRANIEAETAFSIAKTMILPAALRYQAQVAGAVVATREAGADNVSQQELPIPM